MYNPANEKYAQLTFFSKPLDQQLDHSNRYVELSNKIDWNAICSDIKQYFCADMGRASYPIRLMVGLNIVKHIENISDASVLQMYLENPYVQFFCGAAEFQTEIPCTDTTMTNFRKKIGEAGCKAILTASVKIHDLGIDNKDVAEVVFDTTAQCKNVAYPNDINLLKKVAEGCVKLAHKYNIKLKNTYAAQINECLKIIRFEKSTKPERMKIIRKAKKRIYTIAYALYRELMRKMSQEQKDENEEELKNFKKVIDQSKINKNPIARLRDEIKDLLETINKAKETCSSHNMSLSKRDNEKLENLIDSFKNATGRGLEKALREILAALKRMVDRIIKMIQKNIDDINNNTFSDTEREELEGVKDELHSSIHDKRIYSLHEPHVRCITKGKVGVDHEYGSKASIAITKQSAIIVGACNFSGNTHDSNTVTGTADSIAEITGVRSCDVWVDRGYRGAQEKNPDINLHIPSTPTSDMSAKEKAQVRADFGRRSSIEPVIGHLKSDFRLRRNYLKGELGDAINLLLACAAFNFKKWINMQAKKAAEAKSKSKK